MPASGSKAAARLRERAARAELLAPLSPSASAPLRFAAALFRAQARIADALAAVHGRVPLTGDLQADATGLIEPGRALLEAAVEAGPPPLAEEARERAGEDAEVFASRLHVYWIGALDGREDYLSRALLRPYCATLTGLALAPQRPRPRSGCPACGGAASVAARRPDTDSARRFLCCALCGGEWPVNRIRCPACGEEDPYKLPTFQSDLHPTARIEGCETCRGYVKSLDLSTDGRLVPEVDDLASLGLDLWAIEQGFKRIEPGLAGI
jgi:formate dehydrogenase maturation protein FdhE